MITVSRVCEVVGRSRRESPKSLQGLFKSLCPWAIVVYIVYNRGPGPALGVGGCSVGAASRRALHG